MAASAISQAQTNRVDGQIYITTKGAATIRLSSVRVRVYQPDAFKNAQKAWVNDCLSILRAKTNDIEWRNRVSNLVKAMPQMTTANQVVARKTYDTLVAQIETNSPVARREPDFLPVFLRKVDLQPLSTTTSDAEGNFSLEVPPGSWLAVAFASRKVGSEDERYTWIVPIPESGRLLLNNLNRTPD